MSRTPSHVFSTVTSAIKFVKYSPVFNDNVLPVVLATVEIKGGANLPQGHRTADQLWTPKGIATPITEAQYDMLMADPLFCGMVADGYLSFGNFANDAEAAAKDMRPKDGSAPKTEADYRGVKNNTDGHGITVGRQPEAIMSPN